MKRILIIIYVLMIPVCVVHSYKTYHNKFITSFVALLPPIYIMGALTDALISPQQPPSTKEQTK